MYRSNLSGKLYLIVNRNAGSLQVVVMIVEILSRQTTNIIMYSNILTYIMNKLSLHGVRLQRYIYNKFIYAVEDDFFYSGLFYEEFSNCRISPGNKTSIRPTFGHAVLPSARPSAVSSELTSRSLANTIFIAGQ
jgi:hypothetical protein